jgi:hypothetical protein
MLGLTLNLMAHPTEAGLRMMSSQDNLSKILFELFVESTIGDRILFSASEYLRGILRRSIVGESNKQRGTYRQGHVSKIR